MIQLVSLKKNYKRVKLLLCLDLYYIFLLLITSSLSFHLILKNLSTKHCKSEDYDIRRIILYMDETIGGYLEKLRHSCGYSLRLAAKKTSLSHGYIRDVELGRKNFTNFEIIPKPDTLKKFAVGYRASFSELMRIAGHIVTKPTNEFEFIELDFNKVLYIRIDINDTVTYHSSTQTFFESKSLFEFSLFEHSLEKNGYLRIKSGWYVNLKMVKRYDEFTGELSFCEDFENNNIRIPKILAISVQKEISKAIKQNNLHNFNNSYKPFIRTIRNLIIH